MDDNTLKALLACIGLAQIGILGYFTYKQNMAQDQVTKVHLAVTGLARWGNWDRLDAAAARGELAGRDFEAARTAQIGAASGVDGQPTNKQGVGCPGQLAAAANREPDLPGPT